MFSNAKTFLRLLLATVIFMTVLPVFAYDNFEQMPDLSSYKAYKIQSGVFIKGFLLKEISSEINNSGDKVFVQSPFDICVESIVLIPKNAILTGYISEIARATKGQNGLFKINIDEIIFPNGHKQEISAHIWSKNADNVFGGEFSPRSSYRKVVHKSQGLGLGTLQALPDGPRLFGKETKLNAGSDIIIQLDKDFESKYTP